jgi:formylglycine-generating enzyme
MALPIDRRQFLADLTGVAAGIALLPSDRPALADARDPSASVQDRSLQGTRAGEERQVEGTTLCWCPPGRFVMGSPASERGHRPDEAQVEVTLTRGFWTAKSEVTQGQWMRAMRKFPDRLPSPEFGEGDDVAVYWINFDEAEAYCAAMSRSAHASGALPAGWRFSLPTEAQWEYACRAGTVTATAFGHALTPSHANFAPEAVDRTIPIRGSARKVGSYAANAWGIHDMHGNVWEWCRDFYHPRLPGGTDPDLSQVKGMANRDGTYSRVRRGGAWIEPEWACRSACRLRYESHRRSDHIGFRVFVVPA